MEDVYQATLSKIAFLEERGYTVVQMWGCQLQRQLKEDLRMRAFFTGLKEIPDPMNHRSALKGGNVNTRSLS